MKFSAPYILWISLIIFMDTMAIQPAGAEGRGPTDTYYIRLDSTSSSHRIVDRQLIMVPAYNEFRAERFSLQAISRAIQADRQTSDHTLENLAKKDAFIHILEQKGLKSISTLDRETVVSYEGMVRTPIGLQIAPHDGNGYPFTAQIWFAPIAFPDRWESMHQDFEIKKLLNDFILLFK